MRILTVFLFIILVFSDLFGQGVPQKATPPIDFQMKLMEGFELGQTNIFQVELSSRSDLVDINISIEPSAGIKIDERRFDATNLAPNAPLIISTNATVLSEGKHTVEVSVSGKEPKSGTSHFRKHIFFLIAFGDRAIFNQSGFINLEIQELNRRLQADEITPEEHSVLLEELSRSKGSQSDRRKNQEPSPKLNRDQDLRDYQLKRLELQKSNDSVGIDPEKRGGTVTVTGQVFWTDRNGTTHPVRFSKIDIFDEDLLINDLLATTESDAMGAFSVVVSNDDISGGVDVFVRVYCQSVGNYACKPEGGSIYFMESAVQPEQPDGGTVTIPDLIANNNDDNQTVFSVGDALVESTLYANQLPGISPTEIEVFFPASGSFFDGTSLFIHQLDRWDWDVSHHEYGHYIADIANIEDNPGGPHGLNQNLSETLGKNAGTRLAWGEAWPTYFALSLQQEMNSASLNVPAVGDLNYDDTEDLTISYNIETNAGGGGLGEDNEVAVQRAIWDVYDSAQDDCDELAEGDIQVWNQIRNVSAVRMSDVWNGFIAGATTLETTQYGSIFMVQAISPEPLMPAENAGYMMGTNFTWNANGGGPTFRNNSFVVKFYNEDFTTLIHETAMLTMPSYTMDQATADILTNSGETIIKWLVEGDQTASPQTGTYISKPRSLSGAAVAFVIDDTGSMSEEISGVRNALSAFIASLQGSPEPPPIINVITFKDTVTSVIVSNDLNQIQAVVDGLTATGGNDCPEASVQALNLAGSNLANGGRILLATDASPHPGLDRSATISALRSKGIRVDVLLSSDCEPFASTLNIAAARNHENAAPEGTAVSAVVAFSEIANATGGIFAFLPGVNASSPELFENSALNMMLGIAEPRIVISTPPIVPKNSTVNLLLKGSNTNFNASTLVFFEGPGITVNSTTALSSFEVLVNVSVSATAPSGFRNVEAFTNSLSESATGLGVLEVVSETFFPTIAGIFPDSIARNQSVQVTISGIGTSFSNDSNVELGTGILVTSVSANSAIELTAQITITEDAPLGFRDVRVTSGSEIATENQPGPLLITEGGLLGVPQIIEVIPSQVMPGQTASLSIVGLNTSFEDGVSSLSFGGMGILVLDQTVLSPTELLAEISVDPVAPFGFQDVIVNTNGETAVRLGGIEITDNVVVPIPTLGQWGLIFFCVLLATGAIVFSSRNRQQFLNKEKG